MDVLSIDGFECMYTDSHCAFDAHNEHLGAGHPGEDDIGGLILVSIAFLLVIISLICAFLACARRGRTEGTVYSFWRHR